MKIIYEDKHIVVVEKPQNCPVQRDQTKQRCLLDMVTDYYEFTKGIDNPYLGLVHRLDRHTGGIVVFARTEQATRTLSALFASHALSKRYTALVEGKLEEGRGVLVDYLVANNKINKTEVVSKADPNAKMAKLNYLVTDVFETKEGLISELSIKLFTGRQHQIRAQFSNLGHPIVADEKYGSKWPNATHISMALWATELKFSAFGTNYHFNSTPPESGIWVIKHA